MGGDPGSPALTCIAGHRHLREIRAKDSVVEVAGLRGEAGQRGGSISTHPWHFYWDQSHAGRVMGVRSRDRVISLPPLHPRLRDPLEGHRGSAGWAQQSGQTDSKASPSTGTEPRRTGAVTPPCPPPKPHHQQLEQCRRVPVARGVEEQHTRFGAAAGRMDRWPVSHRPVSPSTTTMTRPTPACPHCCVPSLLVGLVPVKGSLAEPADAGLDAAGRVGPVQVPRHGAMGQHLGPAQPLRVPQPWGGGHRA